MNRRDKKYMARCLKVVLWRVEFDSHTRKELSAIRLNLHNGKGAKPSVQDLKWAKILVLNNLTGAEIAFLRSNTTGPRRKWVSGPEGKGGVSEAA